LIWHCAKSQVDKETQFILGITPIHIYCYPNLTFCDSFTGRFNNSQEFFDKQKQSDTVDFDSIDVSEGFLLRSPADFAPEWEVISNRNNLILVRAENNYYLLEQKKDRLVHRKQLDFDSIVREVKTDIKEDNFLEKYLYYMDLLKVDRAEFEDYLSYEFTYQEMEEMIASGEDEPIWDMTVTVNEVKVFDRLFALYCPDTGFVIPPKN
jgi:hypothetical protein